MRVLEDGRIECAINKECRICYVWNDFWNTLSSETQREIYIAEVEE